MMAEEIPPHTISDMANLSVIPSPHVQCTMCIVCCTCTCIHTWLMLPSNQSFYRLIVGFGMGVADCEVYRSVGILWRDSHLQ